jgi:hypothetical protein
VNVVELLPELEALGQYRLDHDLTWVQLSSEMREHDAYVAPSALHKHVEAHAKDRRGPYKRTLHKVRKFLKAKDAAPAAAHAASNGGASKSREGS